MSEENTVYIGKKNLMAYVLACITLFHNGAKEVVLKARGRSISRAVDVAELVKNRFATGAEVKNVTIGTETVQTEDGKPINVSTIEIVLQRKE
ncbi:MAG: DNA-binding protein Alba [Candidatus Asgardarchaeia archaeon]|nr:DNA-binding protein Alba [Candidatus Odinarchaeota archaeon]